MSDAAVPANAPLARVLRYNRWANLTLFDACRALTDAQLDIASPGRDTVRHLLVHIAGGQQTFVLRTKGRQHEGELNRRSPWPGFDALMQIITQTSDDLVAVAEALVEDCDVDLSYMGRTSRHPMSFFLAHAVEHGIEHRTEIKIALEAAGVATPDLDGWAWSAAEGIGREV